MGTGANSNTPSLDHKHVRLMFIGAPFTHPQEESTCNKKTIFEGFAGKIRSAETGSQNFRCAFGGRREYRGRKNEQKLFFSHKLLNTPRDPGHPSKIPGTSQAPPFETQRRQTFERGHELFDHHLFEWKTPTPTQWSPDLQS